MDIVSKNLDLTMVVFVDLSDLHGLLLQFGNPHQWSGPRRMLKKKIEKIVSIHHLSEGVDKPTIVDAIISALDEKNDEGERHIKLQDEAGDQYDAKKFKESIKGTVRHYANKGQPRPSPASVVNMGMGGGSDGTEAMDYWEEGHMMFNDPPLTTISLLEAQVSMLTNQFEHAMQVAQHANERAERVERELGVLLNRVERAEALATQAESTASGLASIDEYLLQQEN